ncbi:MAG TPA: cation diffusion facilitator family transporter [Candidatus Paceibacterota bacterium]
MSHRHFNHDSKDCYCEIRTYQIVLAIGIIVCVFELIGSLLSGSVLLLSDTFHVLADTIQTGIALLTALTVVKQRENESDIRSISGYISGILLVILGTAIIREALEKLFNPQPIKAGVMLSFALIGAIANGWSLWLVHAYNERTITQRAAFRHLLVDLSQSLVVIVAGIFIASFQSASFLDPLLSIAIALYSFWLGYITIRDARTASLASH